MNIKVNGFRVGVMAVLMAIGASGCKKEGPYALMPKGFVSQKMEHVVDSFYQDGLKYANSSDYVSIKQDTIKMTDYYAHCPGELASRLEHLCHDYDYATDKNGVEQRIHTYDDTKLVVSSNQVFTNDSIGAYIAVEEYAKIK